MPTCLWPNKKELLMGREGTMKVRAFGAALIIGALIVKHLEEDWHSDLPTLAKCL